jgi:release factor glutamine methyltransferase
VACLLHSSETTYKLFNKVEMRLTQLIRVGVETLSDLYPDQEARELVFVCLEHFLGTKRHTHIVEPQYDVEEGKVSLVMEAFERMATGEPLQYVTGKAYFYGREFRVTSDTLIPRPETELLCRMAVDSATKPDSKVLDLCTGSGCIAWTLALELPRAEVTAVDISDGALAVASAQNFAEEISRTGANAPYFRKIDVLAGVSDLGAQQFDMILSNPPYVMDKEKIQMRSNVLEHEPHLALFVPDADPLLFYRAVADWSIKLLASDGVGIVEINEALGEETAEVFRSRGFKSVLVIKDLYEKDRFVRFAWK